MNQFIVSMFSGYLIFTKLQNLPFNKLPSNITLEYLVYFLVQIQQVSKLQITYLPTILIKFYFSPYKPLSKSLNPLTLKLKLPLKSLL